jgi:O-antigen ligase
MFIKFLDRVPRAMSLLGLLGLVGLAGIFNPQLSRFSALSFLSYLCYFRFLRWFVQPQPPLTGAGLFVPLLGVLLWIVPQTLYPELIATATMFGLLGFAGFLGLYQPATSSQKRTTS